MVEPIADPDAESTVHVAAPPAVVWSLVSDATRTPEWSPVVHRCEWAGKTREPSVGARFVGHNRLNGARWSRECQVTESERGRVFAFSTLFKGEESTRWRYLLAPEDDGTAVTLQYQVVMMPRWVRAMRLLPGVKAKGERDIRWNFSTSLARLKAAVEAGAAREAGAAGEAGNQGEPL